MADFEKLGAFYLGRECDPTTGALGAEAILYDSKDLTTHAAIIGMTGSGKTGLGVALIEEAAIDGVPVIAVDPKGDLGNLLLTFPELAGADFEPWIDAQQAATQGRTPAQYADDQASLWRNGLGEWGQDGERIRRLREAAEFAVFTPGSTAGIPVSALRSFDAPNTRVRNDSEAFAERVAASATSLLALLGIDADPLSSREHILLANILQHAWAAGRSLDLPGLITAIQNPPIDKIGVMDLEAVYPAKDRFALAMRLNNLLASPGFAAWLEGVPLDARQLFYTASGKPRVSILSIAHLNDAERMFFVTLLLAEIIAWMRAQSGTSSLRAILYMDELFGFMPPLGNPPSKALLLTLLKQARAFGLGLVLSTQNPVDLDYKGLSNTGTWFIGRLQTERDKARLLDGLAGAGGGGFDRGQTEELIAGLGKRRFLLHNVHESEPALMETRWVMSYLAGPLTREQIRTLMADRPAPAVAIATTAPSPAAPRTDAATTGGGRPALAPEITQYFVPSSEGAPLTYYPRVVGAANVVYSHKTYGVHSKQTCMLEIEVDEGPAPLNWGDAQPLALTVADLTTDPAPQALFTEPAAPARDAASYRDWSRDFKRWLRNERPLTLHRNKAFKAVSEVGESESDFRIRMRQLAREQRDVDVGKLRTRFERKAGGLRKKLRTAEAAIERETAQSSQRKIDTAVSIGSALLGAFLGRKGSMVGKLSTAARRAGSARKEAGDVARAEEKAQDLRAQLERVATEFETEAAALERNLDAQAGQIEPVSVRANSSNIDVQFVALVWLPYRTPAGGVPQPAFEI